MTASTQGTLRVRVARRVREAEGIDSFELVREELGETIIVNESLGAPSARAMMGVPSSSWMCRKVSDPRCSATPTVPGNSPSVTESFQCSGRTPMVWAP